ncbi:MAG: FAD-binding protein [Chloroflexi bacterium]|nr:FAD-binding protein [Chloroflexota bacterium]
MRTETRTIACDVLVIGGGAAACFAAIKAREAGIKDVIQVSKSWAGKGGNSTFACGVFHVCFPEDDMEDRVRRLVRASGYLALQDLIQDHWAESWDRLKDCERLGVQFVRTPDGELERHGGRGFYPPAMFKGTQLMDALAKASRRKGVKQINKVMVTDLLTKDDRVTGAVGFDTMTGDFYVFRAGATVLATGSSCYKGPFTGHHDNTGDGYMAAYRAGAVLSGAESNDLPSLPCIYNAEIAWLYQPLIAMGARMINRRGETFMDVYNPHLKDQAGAKFLSGAVAIEVRRGNGPIRYTTMDVSAENVRKCNSILRQPGVMLERAGFVLDDRYTRQLEQRLMMWGRAGLTVNRRFETNLPGLYACGEAAASQAVPTGVVAAITSGAKAGRCAAEYVRGGSEVTIDQSQVEGLRQRAYAPLHRKEGIEPDQVITAMQDVIFPYDVLILRQQQRLEKALAKIEEIRDSQAPYVKAYDPHYLKDAHEGANMLLIAEIHLKTAMLRKETRVGIREDYPYCDNLEWLKWIKVRKDGDSMDMFTEDVPIEKYPLKVKREKFLDVIWNDARKAGYIRVEQGSVAWA